MKKSHLIKLFALILTAIMLSFTSCEAIDSIFGIDSRNDNGSDIITADECEHTKTKTVTVTEATCIKTGLKEVRCADCDVKISESVTDLKSHNYKSVDEERVSSTCTQNGLLVLKCTECADRQESVLASMGHSYTELKTAENIKVYNSDGGYVTFYKSCKKCGEKSASTFSVAVGTAEDYQPVSPTLTMYQTEDGLSYGFTYICKALTLDSGITIKKKSDSEWQYYPATVIESAAYLSSGERQDQYICKAVVPLEANTEYVYKFTEKILGIESDAVSFTSADPSVSSFTFASFSDSQNTAEDGSLWSSVLAKVNENVDFYLHSGDICQHPEKEDYWENMVDANSSYLLKKPLMVISGNHETVYGVDNVIYNHFNNNIPSQSTVGSGYYYSFVYGNTKFIMLNTNKLDTNNQLTSDQYNWLIKELENNTSKWTIVTMHNPIYSIGKYGSHVDYNEIAMALRAQLSDVFAKYGVDIVLQGHDHAISKTYPIAENNEVIESEKSTVDGIVYEVDPDGTIYIMNGPTGDQTRGAAGDVEYDFYEVYKTSKAQSWAEYTVTEDSITVTVKYLSGSTVKEYYSFGIIKE